MADSQEYEMGNGDFSQDVGGEEYNQDDQMNGDTQNGGQTTDNATGQGPGRDDDR